MTVPVIEETTEPVASPAGVLAEAEAEAQEAIEEALVAQIILLWLLFVGDEDAPWDGDAVVEFATSVAELVQDAQAVAGDITETHIREQLDEMGFGDLLPEQPIVDLPDSLRLGVEPEDTWQRPIRKLRYLIAEGNDPEVSRETALNRLEAQVRTDLQLARVNAAQQVMYALPEEGPVTITGWRRIIHPELGNVCGLCIAASDRIYQRVQRMDIHPGCKCTILAIVVDADGTEHDPGRTLNAEDLARIYEAAGDTTESRALAKLRIQVRENGELGPILMADGAEFTSRKKRENQLSSAAAEQRRRSIDSQLNKLRAKVAERPNQWYADRIEQLEELAAAS